MLIKSVGVMNVFSFPSLHAELGSGTTIVTGPNGVGKSNLGRCLDLACSVVEFYARDNPGADRTVAFQSAGYWGAETFEVAVSLVLDQPWEHELVLAFVRAAFVYGATPNGTDGATPASLELFVRTFLDEKTVSVMNEGTLRVRFDRRRSMPWYVAWEFGSGDQVWDFVLIGKIADRVTRHRDDNSTVLVGTSSTFTQAFYRAASSTAPIKALTSLAGIDTSRSIDFTQALPASDERMSFEVPTPSNALGREADCRRELLAQLGASDDENRIISFTRVMWAFLRRGIIFTDNRRLPARSDFTVSELEAPHDLRDGSTVAAQLFYLKNGSAHERQRYSEIVKLYAALTGCRLGLRCRPISDAEMSSLRIEPTIVAERGEIPVAFSGAGREEALVLATLLFPEQGRLLVLDEPAVNLEPTMQRRLISVLREAGQVLVVTHNPDMVPVDNLDDLPNIVRLAPVDGGVVVRRAPQLTPAERIGWQKMLEPSHVRALLFAAQVILCEGPTETGALSQWWRDTAALGLPNPEATHTPIISVGGDASFGAYIRYLDAFGIPWAVVADGPALRGTSNLAKQLAKRPYASLPPQPADKDDFDAWRDFWEQVGVFTLADQFGDDGAKGGEFEAYAGRVDATAFAQAKKDGGSSKPRVGTCFALEHPTPPTEVTVLYQQIMKHFGYINRGKDPVSQAPS